MNKKRIIVIISMIVAIACVGGLVGFNIYNNKKMEVQAQTQKFEREYATATPLNEKNNDGDYKVASSTNQSLQYSPIQAVDFFNEALQKSLNIADTSKIDDIKQYQKDNFSNNLQSQMSKMYSSFKTLSITSVKILSVRQCNLHTLDGEDVTGYQIDYICNFRHDGTDDIIESTATSTESSVAFVSVKNSKMYIEQF